jgi:hypothetical protein
MPGSSDRWSRQEGLVPRERLAGLEVTIVGVGAIGRQVAWQLAALGVPHLRLVDFDRVEPTNVTTQGYHHEDLGRAKVDAAASAVWQIDPTIRVDTIEDRFRPQLPLGDALFCCVDSIAARAAIWRRASSRVQFWCDGRMLGEVIRVLTVAGAVGHVHYPTTLFAPADAHVGTCTSRGTIYTACLAASLMLHQFTRWLRNLPVDADLSLNLLASELTVA